MGTATFYFDAWGLAWREFCKKLAPGVVSGECRHRQGLWRRLRGRPPAVVLQDVRYCQDKCLELALVDTLRRIAFASQRTVVPHRVPLGLLLLSRQQLTVEQLRVALEAQRNAGQGRIGEWLQRLGFASELQITAALARQWSCPVLRTSAVSPGASRSPQIPATLLQSFVVIPVDYVERTATLHLAFGEGIDYSVLYAIEHIVGCHTECCMAVPSFVRRKLQALSAHRGEHEIVFDRVADDAEFSRIIRSYCARLAASEIRLAACGPHLWVRLLRPSGPALDLLLRSPADVSRPATLEYFGAGLCCSLSVCDS